MRLPWRNPSWPKKPSTTREPHTCPGHENMSHIAVCSLAIRKTILQSWLGKCFTLYILRQLDVAPPVERMGAIGTFTYIHSVAYDPRQQRVPPPQWQPATMWFCFWNVSASNRLSRPDTPQRGYSVSKWIHNKHQVALPVTPCFHARKVFLLCGRFLGSILAVATRKKKMRCICTSFTFHPMCNQQINLQRYTSPLHLIQR